MKCPHWSTDSHEASLFYWVGLYALLCFGTIVVIFVRDGVLVWAYTAISR